MKIKEVPEDFYVKEIISFPKKEGNYAYFLIKKINLNTIQAIKIIKRYLGISRKRIRFIGEKDKKAIAEQYISIVNLNKKDATKLENLKHPRLKVKFIGFYNQPVHLGLLKENFFRIIVREVSQKERKNFNENIEIVNEIGFPNYFDEQRFGDVRPINHIIGYCILKRRYDLAVKYFLTLYSEKEHPFTIQARRFLKENWENFREALKLFPKWLDIERSIIHYLVKNPEDYYSALKQIHPKLLRLFVNAFQSYIFNKMLSLLIKESFTKKALLEFSFDTLYFPKEPKKINIEFLPIIGYKTDINKYPEAIKKYVIDLLKLYGVSKEDFKFEDLKILSSEGIERRVFVIPKNFNYEAKNNVYVLKFSLPPGSYATMLVKYLFLV